MDSFDSVCTPAMVYVGVSLIIMFIVCCIILWKQGFTQGILSASGGSSSQLSIICCCTLLLMFTCDISPTISWIIVGIWICCVCSGLIGSVTQL